MKIDPVLRAAVDEAREAVLADVGEAAVGAHLGAVAEDERVVTHFFEATDPGYLGWRWSVTLARAPRSKAVTVDEVVLLPGDTALLPPSWVPYTERVAAADVGPGDLVPVADDDPRLVPGYLVGDVALDGTEARELREATREVGLGRSRVLSLEGREQAATRWYDGPDGPDSPISQAAPAHCGSCGFLVRIAGPLSAIFGACANASSPSDGHVVSFDHGCGAHSDVRLETSARQQHLPSPVLDTIATDAWVDTDFSKR